MEGTGVHALKGTISDIEQPEYLDGVANTTCGADKQPNGNDSQVGSLLGDDGAENSDSDAIMREIFVDEAQDDGDTSVKQRSAFFSKTVLGDPARDISNTVPSDKIEHAKLLFVDNKLLDEVYGLIGSELVTLRHM